MLFKSSIFFLGNLISVLAMGPCVSQHGFRQLTPLSQL